MADFFDADALDEILERLCILAASGGLLMQAVASPAGILATYENTFLV